MKKIFMNLSAGTTLAVAIALTSCNNAAEVKKQVDEQNAKIQTLVDEKLNGLQDQVNAECTAKVDSLANVAYAAWLEEEAAAKKGGKKPAPKPAPKKDTKPSINNRPGSNESENNKGTLNNRPGSNENKENKGGTLNKRPGATGN
ncbi:MAG TPA: hypothetical protein VK154_05055 [Chitinophagales bacterium]|nr:hypothetical protein [Chitinophagales bacterium]